jgi:hypothetical protein
MLALHIWHCATPQAITGPQLAASCGSEATRRRRSERQQRAEQVSHRLPAGRGEMQIVNVKPLAMSRPEPNPVDNANTIGISSPGAALKRRVGAGSAAILARGHQSQNPVWSQDLLRGIDVALGHEEIGTERDDHQVRKRPGTPPCSQQIEALRHLSAAVCIDLEPGVHDIRQRTQQDRVADREGRAKGQSLGGLRLDNSTALGISLRGMPQDNERADDADDDSQRPPRETSCHPRGDCQIVRDPDGIHLNDTGSQVAADAVIAAMRGDFVLK